MSRTELIQKMRGDKETFMRWFKTLSEDEQDRTLAAMEEIRDDLGRGWRPGPAPELVPVTVDGYQDDDDDPQLDMEVWGSVFDEGGNA